MINIYKIPHLSTNTNQLTFVISNCLVDDFVALEDAIQSEMWRWRPGKNNALWTGAQYFDVLWRLAGNWKKQTASMKLIIEFGLQIKGK